MTSVHSHLTLGHSPLTSLRSHTSLITYTGQLHSTTTSHLKYTAFAQPLHCFCTAFELLLHRLCTAFYTAFSSSGQQKCLNSVSLGAKIPQICVFKRLSSSCFSLPHQICSPDFWVNLINHSTNHSTTFTHSNNNLYFHSFTTPIKINLNQYQR